LVEFQLNYVLDKYEPRKVIAALATLPQNLPAAYNDVLARIERRGADRKAVAMKIFSWVFHAREPLRIEELQEAIVVEDGDTGINEEYLLDPPFIVDVCGSLVGYGKGHHIAFTHYTVQEFFQNEGASFLLPVSYVAKTCLTYLAFNELDSVATWESDHDASPFCVYAGRYWPLHVQATMETSTDIQISVLELLISTPLLSNLEARSDSIAFSSPRVSGDGRRIGWRGTAGMRYVLHHESSLHKAARHGFLTICKWLLGIEDAFISQGFPEELKPSLETFRKTVDVNAKDIIGATALHVASSSGNEAIVEFLLNFGPDLSIQNSFGSAALDEAAWGGHSNIVRRLLSSGALVNSKDDYGYTALHSAASSGHLETIKILCENGADIKATDDDGYTALDMALLYGEMDRHTVVEVLDFEPYHEDGEYDKMQCPDYEAVPSL
jgi:hypothetical protein